SGYQATAGHILSLDAAGTSPPDDTAPRLPDQRPSQPPQGESPGLAAARLRPHVRFPAQLQGLTARLAQPVQWKCPAHALPGPPEPAKEPPPAHEPPAGAARARLPARAIRPLLRPQVRGSPARLPAAGQPSPRICAPAH